MKKINLEKMAKELADVKAKVAGWDKKISSSIQKRDKLKKRAEALQTEMNNIEIGKFMEQVRDENHQFLTDEEQNFIVEKLQEYRKTHGQSESVGAASAKEKSSEKKDGGDVKKSENEEKKENENEKSENAHHDEKKNDQNSSGSDNSSDSDADGEEEVYKPSGLW